MDRVISGHVQFQGAESPDGIFSPHKLDTTRSLYPNSEDPFAPSLSDQGRRVGSLRTVAAVGLIVVYLGVERRIS